MMFILNRCDLITLVSAFLPILRRPLWFVSTYIELVFLSPFLNLLLTKLTRPGARLLVAILTIIIPIQSSISSFHDSPLDSLAFFLYVYILMYYIRNYRNDKASIMNGIVIGGMLYIILNVVIFLQLMDINPFFNNAGIICKQYIGDYKSIPNLVIAISLLYSVANMKSIYSGAINQLAKACITVYIIHQTPAFYPFMWSDLVKVSSWSGSNYSAIFIFISAVIIFLGCFVIDYVCENYILRKVYNSKLENCIEKKINYLYCNKDA